MGIKVDIIKGNNHQQSAEVEVQNTEFYYSKWRGVV